MTREEVIEEMVQAVVEYVRSTPAHDRVSYAGHVRAALDAASRAGFALVPREPSREMIRLGGDECFDVYQGYNEEMKRQQRMRTTSCERKALACWSAMLAEAEKR